MAQPKSLRFLRARSRNGAGLFENEAKVSHSIKTREEHEKWEAENSQPLFVHLSIRFVRDIGRGRRGR